MFNPVSVNESVICKASRRSAAIAICCLRAEIALVSMQTQPLQLAQLCSMAALKGATQITSWLAAGKYCRRKLLSLRKRLAYNHSRREIRLAQLTILQSELKSEKALMERALNVVVQSTNITRTLLSGSLLENSSSISSGLLGCASGLEDLRACQSMPQA